MKENIEIKDVQRTEYLDKNGLDMLWAKVKENTHNQVEVERNRAVAKENSIADTKADKSALDNYVLSSTLAALEQKVTDNTTAISAKQDAGNYVPYELYNNDYGEFYKMPKNIAFQYDDSSKDNITMIKPHGIIVYRNIDKSKVENAVISPEYIKFNRENGGSQYFGKGLIQSYRDRFDLDFQLDKNGIMLYHGNNNEVLTSGGSTINITQYAKKTEVSDFISKTATKEQFGVVKVGDGLNVNAGVISIAPDYLVDMMSYGVEWDVTVADPTCTRIGNPLFHKSLPIQSEYKGCVVKNGKLQYYLNPNDWTKTSNGSNSNLDGTDGDVMIHTPKFYGKSGSNGNKRWVRISTVKVDASWVEIPEMFISAYHNTIYTDGDTTKIASVVSTDAKYRGGGRRSEYDQYLSTDQFKTDLGKPVSNISRATMRTYAAATGQELLCYEFYKWIFYWNYVIEYANFNSQKEFNSELTSDGYHQGGLGPGLTTWDWGQWSSYNGNYAITPCGYTNEFGNFSGVKAIQLQSSEKTLYVNRWRGFENPFGDIWTNLEGIVIKRDVAKANSNVYTTTDVSKYGEDYSLFDIAGVEIAQDGWIGTFDLGSNAEIIPSSIARSESTYKCDYHWCDVDSIENRTLLVGGNAGNGSLAGLGAFFSYNGVGDTYFTVGFRSVIRA